MIFQALHELYARLEADPAYDVAPCGKSHQKVTFVVVLDPNGNLVGIQDARQEVKGRKIPKPVLVLGDTKPPGSGMKPCFLWDAPGYLLGWQSAKDPGASGKRERAKKTFQAFRKKHLELEKEIGVPEFSAVCRFLERWDPSNCSRYPVLEEVGSGFGVFQIRGETRYVHEHPMIVEWWEKRQSSKEDKAMGQCLITGKTAGIARLHPKIKRVDGSQRSGATIAGFNDPAYWSFGLKQSYNAPVSKEAAHRYVTALNALLDSPRSDKHRLVVGGTTVAFWTDRPCPTEDIFLPFAGHGSSLLESALAQDEGVRARVEAFLKALRRGREAYAELDSEPETRRYFIVGLAAPTPARIAVRFFHRGTLGELLDNLRRHHRDIAIERQFGEGSKNPEPEFPPVQLLLEQTCPRKNNLPDREKIPPLLAGPLLEAVVAGARYPDGLFAAVMRRIAAERSVNYPRACVIKGYLVRNVGKEISMSLDTTRPEPAYRLGRLFAALERTQKDALGSLNTTIRDSFYASASATPAAVFPRLLRTYQHHLAKLEGGHKVNRERLVQEILAPLSEMPAHLGLAEQGLFALGYYHQMNAFFTKKEDQETAARN